MKYFFFIIAAIKEEKRDLLVQIQSKNDMLEGISVKNAELDERVITLQKELHCQANEKLEVEERICKLQSSYEKEKSDLEERSKDLQNAKDLLLNSKVQLQNALEDANARTDILKEEIEKVKLKSRQAEDELRTELEHIKNELVSILQYEAENILVFRPNLLDLRGKFLDSTYKI